MSTTELDSPPPPTSSLAGRLANIIAAPGEVFDEIKGRPVALANWLVPMILTIFAGWIATGVINSQDFAEQQMMAMQQEAFQPQINSGKMTQQQADQALRLGHMVATVIKYAGIPFVTAAALFVGGLVFWLVGTKALKGQFDYMKGVEAMGLISVLGVLAQIVRVSLVLVKGNVMASPSLALLLEDMNPRNPLFLVLSVVEVFSFWWLGLVCLGLMRLTGASFGRVAAWVFGIWGAFTAAMLGVAMLGIMASRLLQR